jgi:hypothetical protein
MPFFDFWSLPSRVNDARITKQSIMEMFYRNVILVVQDLVRDDSEDRSSFLRIVQEEIAQGPITGPSVPKRVASELRTIGVAVRQRERPDPMAQIAQARLDTILQWCKQQPDLAPAHGEHRKKAPVEFLSALSRVIRSRRKS